MKNLPRSTPEKQGVKSQAITDFLKKVKEHNQEIHSFMLVKNGHVISECWWEPYAPQYRHPVYTISKAFTSTGIGMAVDEGLLNADTLVADIFKQEIEELGSRIDEKIKKMTIRHLMTMTTGIEYDDWDWNGNNIKNFLSSHIKHEPGSIFRYHSFLPAYMESAAVTRLTGQTLFDYLKPRLFDPLGIEAVWEDIEGVTYGCNYIEASTEDIAKFGQLYLQKGVWDGKRLISEKWIDEAISHGYHLSKCNIPAGGKPDGVYSATGWRGQYSIVMPDANSVIAITSDTEGETLLNLIWDILLPALSENNEPNDDVSGYEKMKDAQKNLSHLTVNKNVEPFPTFKGEYKAKDESKVYRGVEKIRIEFADDECLLALHYKESKIAGLLRFRNNEWFENTCEIHGFGFNGGGYRTKTLGEWRTKENENIFIATHWHYEDTHGKSIIRIKFAQENSKLTLQFDGSIYGESTISDEYVKI